MNNKHLHLVILVCVAATLLLTMACQHPNHNRWDLRCIRAHESDTAGSYAAQNPYSSASGAYQFIDGTWRRTLQRMGRAGEYSRAVYAPPIYQDMVALWLLDHGGQSAWAGTGCFR